MVGTFFCKGPDCRNFWLGESGSKFEGIYICNCLPEWSTHWQSNPWVTIVTRGFGLRTSLLTPTLGHESPNRCVQGFLWYKGFFFKYMNGNITKIRRYFPLKIRIMYHRKIRIMYMSLNEMVRQNAATRGSYDIGYKFWYDIDSYKKYISGYISRTRMNSLLKIWISYQEYIWLMEVIC